MAEVGRTFPPAMRLYLSHCLAQSVTSQHPHRVGSPQSAWAGVLKPKGLRGSGAGQSARLATHRSRDRTGDLPALRRCRADCMKPLRYY